jgi:hypothetical protein
MAFERTFGRLGAVMLTALLADAAETRAEPAGIAVVVADFDNEDTSGEDPGRTAAHAARVASFSDRLGEAIAARGYKVVPLDCPTGDCTAKSMTPDALIAAARASGARVLVYGGIHKMSTLVQMGTVHAVDLQAEKLVLDRFFSFRGDSDEAFSVASSFLARQFDQASAAP